MQQQTSPTPEYDQLPQSQVAVTQPQQIMIVQHPMGTALGYASKSQAIQFEYESINQRCCCCSFRFWALFMWSVMIVGSIIMLIVGGIQLFFTYAACTVIDASVDALDSDTSTDIDDTVDAFCTFYYVIFSIIVAVGLIELVSVSIIIHGIRKYNSCVCIFGCVLSVLNVFGSFAGVQNYLSVSMLSFGLSSLTFIFTVGHTYYVCNI